MVEVDVRMEVAAGLILSLPLAGEAWRSALYPEDWSPPTGKSFYEDAFLQDFSYAGYHRGEVPLPEVSGPVFDVSQAPFLADPSGKQDATSAIQRAIDSAQAAGGGVVFLPEGTYRVSLPAGARSVLKVSLSGVVVRGAGAERTFLLNTTTTMRGCVVLEFAPAAGTDWHVIPRSRTLVRRDLPSPTREVPVEDPSRFVAGDWVVVRQKMTEAWIADHRETSWAGYSAAFSGLNYLRRIESIDSASRTLLLDAPLRYALWTRDSAMVYAAPPSLEEVGLEHLSLGNVQHPSPDGWSEEDWDTKGTGAWDAHDSWLVRFDRVHDGWIRGVESFRDSANTSTSHFLSNGIHLLQTRGITIDSCHLQRPQYGGGGGNGYGYRVMGNENLLRDSRSTHCRHGFVLSHMIASGNVFLRVHDQDGGLQTGATGEEKTAGRGNDHHMHFSHSNLFDNCLAENSNFQAAYRPYGSVPKHNLTAAHSVFWNTEGRGNDAWLIHTQQSRYGYVVGTKGTVTKVDTSETSAGSGAKTAPVDLVEGEGAGATLQPASLYADQLRKRLQRESVAVDSKPSSTPSKPRGLRFTGKDIEAKGHLMDGSKPSAP
ncbi:MAG: hypothetical protein H6686_12920 [Fibrobacteria bacterium]|nr:hypothetical protein [Fibrobacteria bacterium]